MLKRKAQVLYLWLIWSFKKKKKKSLSPVLKAHLVILKEKKSPSPILKAHLAIFEGKKKKKKEKKSLSLVHSPLDHFEKKKFKSHS